MCLLAVGELNCKEAISLFFPIPHPVNTFIWVRQINTESSILYLRFILNSILHSYESVLLFWAMRLLHYPLDLDFRAQGQLFLLRSSTWPSSVFLLCPDLPGTSWLSPLLAHLWWSCVPSESLLTYLQSSISSPQGVDQLIPIPRDPTMPRKHI